MVYWLVYTIKHPPVKERPYSYRVFVGNLGISVITFIVVLWFYVKDVSFILAVFNQLKEL